MADDDDDKVAQITIDVMEALSRHRPDLKTVVQTLTEILLGAVMQLKEEHRPQAIELITMALNLNETDLKEIDLTDKINTLAHH